LIFFRYTERSVVSTWLIRFKNYWVLSILEGKANRHGLTPRSISRSSSPVSSEFLQAQLARCCNWATDVANKINVRTKTVTFIKLF